MTALEIAMDKARLAQVRGPLAERTAAFEGSEGEGYHLRGVPPSLLQTTGQVGLPDTSEGMAALFEDTPISKPVAVTTVAFARKFCAEDPYYTWRKL